MTGCGLWDGDGGQSSCCGLACYVLFFFFFKQKTAYDIGLGIPAEPLFRSTLRALADDVHGELTVRIVDERESAELNSRYRRKEGPTNVLSFAAEAASPPGGADLLPFGVVVICADVVAREARE